MATVVSPAVATSSISPPPRLIELSVRLMSPPITEIESRLSPSSTEICVPLKVMPALASPNPKADGAAVVNPEAPVSETSRTESSANVMLFAVERCRLPLISMLAPSPKAMPLGLIKNKLASEIVERSNPSIWLAESPFTRAMMLLMSLLPLKVALSPAFTLKVRKLCSRLVPRVMPIS